MSWTWNKNYKDLGQVEEFYPAYLAVYDEITATGGVAYNDLFKGRIPGIEGEREDTAIYMLQTLRSVRDMEAKVAERRAAGWRDVDSAELDAGPVRFASVAQYGWYMGGTGFEQWEDVRLALYGTGYTVRTDKYQQRSMIVLPGRNRTNGYMVQGRLIVKDA